MSYLLVAGSWQLAATVIVSAYQLPATCYLLLTRYQAHAAGKPLDGALRNVLAEASDAVSTYVDTLRPVSTYKGAGQLALRCHALYVRRTATGLGRAVRKAAPCTVAPQVSTERSTARLTPMASTDQTIASPTFTPMATPIASPWQPSVSAVLTPGPNDVDLRATIDLSPAPRNLPVATAVAVSTAETRDMAET